MALVGGRLFVTGPFEHIGSYSRNHLAAYNAVNGQLDPWNPNPDGYVSALDVGSFALWGALEGVVPRIAVVSGRCFAGNAVLAGCADLRIATPDANLGMAGPAMIAGGGLGDVSAEETAARLRAVTLEPLAEVAVPVSANASTASALNPEGDRS